jgi:rare lipoprotein A
MKKYISVLLFFGAITSLSAQVTVGAKQISAVQKAFYSKTAIGKDTVRKNRNFGEFQDKKLDSVIASLEIYRPYKKAAHASYYANKFTGKKTSSGSRFDNNKYTAAHKKLPFGTFVKVTNEKNGKSVVVEITDRGPFVKSREIDLSKRAFMDITTNKASGGMLVTIEILTK